MKLFKSLISLGCAIFINVSSQAQVPEIKYTDDAGVEHKLRQYYVAFLKSGPTRSQTKEEGEKIQAAHLNYLDSLWKDGKLILNGPFATDTEMRGMSIYVVDSEEEALKLANNDPAVKAGRLIIDLHPWWTYPFSVNFED